MKKFLIMLCIGCGCIFSNASAQIGLSINIGTQPVWGPVGYDHVDYYYIPDIDAYYDVARGVYVYQEGPRWITSVDLPPRYHDFDIYHAHKVVINGHHDPWRNNNYYHSHYHMFRGRHDQTIIRDSHDPRYFANPHHPRHSEWHERPAPHGHPGGHPEGHGHEDRGHGHGGHDEHGHH